MPTVSVYRHGSTCGAGNPDAVPPMRSEVIGWSSSAIRRNLKFLYSVDETALTGDGLALTLTVKDCPPDPDAWRRMREAWFKRQRDRGMVRCHWVTEWQRRGVPHLHLAIWFPSDASPVPPWVLIGDWIDLAKPYGAKVRGQHAVEIYDVLGWNQYVSKHAARGLHHYQRSPENVPKTWQTGTGRMWGNLGEWTLQEPLRVDLSQSAFWAYRRMVRGWRKADARAAAAKGGVRKDANRRIRSARGMLRCPVQELSRVRGVSEWIGEGLNLRMLEGLRQAGHELLSV